MSQLLHTAIFRAFACFSSRPAIVPENGAPISYGKLGSIVNSLSHLIHHKKPTPRSRKPFVGILSSVHHFSIAAVLAILQQGCAYVPLDEQASSARLSPILAALALDLLIIDGIFLEKYADLLRQSSLSSIIVLGPYAPRFSLGSGQQILHFAEAQAAAAPAPASAAIPSDLAYVLHSSGSTGMAKGIMLTHSNARAFTDWMQQEFNVSSSDRVMARAPFKFDLSVFDIFNTLAVGATLICFDWRKPRDREEKHRDYVALLVREQATMLYTTPSTLITLRHRGGLGQHPTALRTIMYAGEPFPIPQLRDLMEALPRVKFANIYGPTETNIITYHWIENLAEDCNAIPLGKVVEGTEIIVVNPDTQQLCARGEIGELWCRGATVTIGYLGMAEESARCLVQSPFHPYPCWYWRTGDFGWRDDKGCLHYRGRRDHMVKIKGYRVELGEIEAQLARFPGIEECCVLALRRKEEPLLLGCCYSTKTQQELLPKALSRHLSQLLPEYMLPHHYCFYSELPKTSSGKIDRVRLTSEVESQC